MNELSWLVLGMSLVFVALLVFGRIRESSKKPSEFAAAIVGSMTECPQSWDYNRDEQWLINDAAALEISLQIGNFGRVNTKQAINAGSSNLAQFVSADVRAFRDAYRKWRSLTAIEREQVTARFRRDAMVALTPKVL